jgi:DNA-binding response OmpR family regulator
MPDLENPVTLRVLVVEDDPLVRRAVTRALRRAGHDVVVAKGCDGARDLSHAVDVAVLDLELPDGTGVDVAGELLGLGATDGVVFFSGAADPLLLRRASRLGTVVAKGGNLRALIEAVSARGNTALAQRGGRSRAPHRALPTRRRKAPQLAKAASEPKSTTR